MRGRRIILAATAAAVVLAAAALILARHHRGPVLPPAARYANLPGAFNDALEKARERAEARPGDPAGLRELAHLYEANRLFAEARACYSALAAGPGGLTPQDHYLLAALAEDENEPDRAEAELRATLEGAPDYVPARRGLADALFKSGRSDEAEKEYARILTTEPDHPEASFGLARIELQRGNDDGAVGRLKAMIARHPDAASGAALLATIDARRGADAEAAALRARSEEEHEPVPPDPWMKELLVDCYDLQRLGIAFEQYRLTGQIAEALPFLDRLQQLDPGGWTAPMLRGWSLKEAGRYPEAVVQYREALDKGGDPERICPLLAATLLTEHEPAQAAAMLAEYRAKLPHSVPILLSSSETAVRMKDAGLARSLLTEVLRAEPYLYLPNMSLYQLLWDAGERDSAAQCLKRVVLVYPGDLDSRGLLAQYFMEKSDPWSAIGPLEQAIEVAPPKDPRRNRLAKMLDTAYLAAGSLEAERGHFDRALALAERSIRFAPEGARGYSLKANVCRRTGDFKGAAAALEKLGSLRPGEPSIQLSLGDAVFQAGDRDGAREHWQRALQLAPADAADLRSALAQRLSGHITAATFR
jgi:tetratricopeptide (TPR) repeat protein